VLARTTDLDNLRRHFDEKCRTFQSSTADPFLQRNRPIMRNVTPEEFAQLQKKFSEVKHSINNALAVMMALSEMSQRRPDYSEKLASTVLTKAPQIVSSLQEFTQALNEKAGTKPASEAK
jgi:chromosome condensin MukBEF ATPase and DNA-binding subunit MukB